jgi:peroxiredoxin
VNVWGVLFMKKRRLVIRTIILILFAVALGYTIYSSAFQKDRSVIQIGDTAPNFLLKDLNGEKLELKNLEGKGVFLNFWGTYCPPCEKEMPVIERQYQTYKSQGIEVVAVNLGETKFVVKDFAKEKSLTFPILLDQAKDTVDAYDIGLLPVTFLIDKDGKIIDRVTGELNDELVIKMMEKIKP